MQTLWLQCKDMLPTKRWEVAEAGGGHLEEGDRCRQLCCEFIDMLNQHWGRCHGFQGRTSKRCEGCELRRCSRCTHKASECVVCGTAWEGQHHTISDAYSENQQFKKSRKRGAPTISVTNMHELGRNFVEEVIDVRETETATVEEAAKGHHIQFKCQIRGWKEDTRARIRASLLSLNDVGLRPRLVHSNGSILFHFTGNMWPAITLL